VLQTPRGAAFWAMADDWEMLTENVAGLAFGFGYEESKRYAAYIRACIDQETFKRFMSERFDVTGQARQIKAPTLVIRHTGLKWLSMESTRELVADIPDARMVAIEGTYTDHADQAGRAWSEFLGGSPAAFGLAPRDVHTILPSGTAVILFADIAGSTALTERMGDAAFRAKARELDTALRGITRENGGTPVEGKLLGDGVLAVFTSARQAIEAALRCGKEGDEAGLPLHLGIHAGDVIREGNNVYGGAVNIAARIAAASAPSEVLVSDTVRSLARTSAGVSFEDRGEQELKGVADPQRLFAVREGGA